MKVSTKSSAYMYISLLLMALFILYFTKETGIFWDNVLFVSKIGGHLFEKGLFSWYIPDEFDPGHPPFLGFIQALGWKLFGRNLFVSHLMMFPFVFGLLVQLYVLVSYFLSETKDRILAFLLICADPTLSAQFTLVNPEVILLFFCFLAVNAILCRQNTLKILALLFLGISSFRGMMLCAGIFSFEMVLVYLNLLNKQKNYKKVFVFYLIGSLPAVIYIIGRLYFKGWINTHPDSPWAEFSEIVGVKDFARNMIILLQRYVDFGRITIIVFCLYMLIKLRKALDKRMKTILALIVSSCLVIVVVSVSIHNPMGHRYFVASYIGIILLAFIFIQELKKGRKWVYILLFLSLVTGNFWIYPRHIAQGWDASLAYFPYFTLREKAITYLDQNNITIGNTGTFFPNATSIDNINLNGDMRSFADFNQGETEYVFYSNVYNLTDDELFIIDTKYQLIKKFSKTGVYIEILQKKP